MNAKEAVQIADGQIREFLVGSEVLGYIEDAIHRNAGRGLYQTSFRLSELLRQFEIDMTEQGLAARLIRYLGGHGYKCDYVKCGDSIFYLKIDWSDA